MSKCTACSSTSTARRCACVDLDPAPELVLDAASIPIEAYGSAGRRRHTVDDVATNHGELVDARRHEVQVALDVVAIMQAALRAATDERDRAAGAFATASGELADAIASKDAAYRAVESLADAVQDDPEDDIVEAELVIEEPPDVDPWAEQRVTRARGGGRCRTPRPRGPDRGGAVGSRRKPRPPRSARSCCARGRPRRRARCRRPRGPPPRRCLRAQATRRGPRRRASRPRSPRARLVQRLPVALVDGRDRPERGASARDRTDRADGSGTSADGGPRRVGSRSRPPALGTRCRASSGGRRGTCSLEGGAAGRVGRRRGPTRSGDPSS